MCNLWLYSFFSTIFCVFVQTFNCRISHLMVLLGHVCQFTSHQNAIWWTIAVTPSHPLRFPSFFFCENNFNLYFHIGYCTTSNYIMLMLCFFIRRFLVFIRQERPFCHCTYVHVYMVTFFIWLLLSVCINIVARNTT